MAIPIAVPLAGAAVLICASAAFAGDNYPDPVPCQNWCKATYERCQAEGRPSCDVFRQDCRRECLSGRPADRFGAIAYDPKTKAAGFSTNYGSRDEADQRALSECKSSRNHCRVVVHFTAGCAALAVDGKSRTWGWGISGLSQDEAELNAVNGCTDYGGTQCGIRVSVCNQVH